MRPRRQLVKVEKKKKRLIKEKKVTPKIKVIKIIIMANNIDEALEITKDMFIGERDLWGNYDKEASIPIQNQDHMFEGRKDSLIVVTDVEELTDVSEEKTFVVCLSRNGNKKDVNNYG